MREIRCDQSGVLLESGKERHQSYLSYQGAGLFYQLEGGGFYRLGTRGKVYTFAGLDEFGDWLEKCMDEADERGRAWGDTVGGPEPDGFGWRRKDFGDERLTNQHD